MLFRSPVLTAADERVLADIDRYRADLRHHVAHPRRWLGQLRRGLVAASIRGSNTIEGYTVDQADAEALAADEDMLTRHDDATTDAVSGYKDALTYVQRAAHFEAFAYQPMLLSALHFMMLRHELDRDPGRYRRGEAWVSGGPDQPRAYTGPDPERVADLTAELCGWLEHGDLDLPAFVRASMAHLNLVSIHPWRGGNGRMSRCLHTLVLAREQALAPEFSSIEEWLGSSVHNTVTYYAALAQAQGGSYRPERDTRDWVRFCLRAHHLQAQVVHRRTEVAAEVWASLAELVETAGLPGRSVAALYAATRPGSLRRTTYARDEGLTRDQTVRDVRGLRAAGLIDEVGHGRRQRHVVTGPALDRDRAIRQAHSQRALVDPYGGTA